MKSLHWSFYFLHTKIWILTYRFLFLFDFWCLMPLSAISWQPVLVVEEANISAISLRPVLVVEEAGENHGQATGKLYHLLLRVECTLFCKLQSQARTHVVLVIGLCELLGNPTT